MQEMKVNQVEKIKGFLFTNTSLKQTILKNTFWLTSGTVVSRLVRAVLIISSARILGAEGYGIISYGLSLAAFFGIFTDIGLSSLLTRESTKDPENIPALLSTTFFLKIAILALAVIVMVFAAPFLTKNAEAAALIPVMAVVLVFDSLRTFGFSITRAKNKMEWEAGLTIATDLFITAFGLAILFLSPEPMKLAWAYALSTALGFLLVLFVLRKDLKGIFTKFEKKLVKPILSKAWPFAIMGLLSGFMINIDTIIIGAFRNATELGLYAAAQRPIQLLYLFPGLIAASIFPILTKLIHEGKGEAVKRVLEKVLPAVFAAALPIALGGIILARPLISLIFGAEYDGSVFTFQLLLSTLLFVFPGTIIGNTIFAFDRQKIFIFSTGTGAITNVVLDLVLIPAYGIWGSAIATIVSQVLVTVINWNYLKKITGFSISKHMAKITLATILMGAATFALLYLGMNVILNVVVSAVIFGSALYLFREPLLKLFDVRELAG